MADKIKIEVEARQAERDLKRAADGLDDVADSTKKQGEAAKSSAKANAGFADKLAAVAAQAVVVKALLVDTVKEYAKVDAANGRLKRSIDNVSASTAETEIRFRAATRAMRENQQFGVRFGEQQEALRQLVDTTGDYEQSILDLNLAIDMQAQEDIDLAKATEVLARARIGDVGALKELGVLTNDQAANLQKVTDETKRAEIAVAALTDKYRGAAAENKGLADELVSLEENLTTVSAATGAVVSAFGKMGTSALVALGVLDDEEASLSSFAKAMENFGEASSDAADAFADFITNVTIQDVMGGFLDPTKNALDVMMEVIDRVEAARARLRASFETQGKNPDGSEPEPGDRMFIGPQQSNEARINNALADQGGTSGGGGRKAKSGPDPVEEAKKKAAAAQEAAAAAQEEARALQMQQSIEAKKLDILRESDEAAKARLEQELAILEIKSRQLDPAIEELQIQQESLKFLQKLKALQADKGKAAVDTAEATNDAIISSEEALSAAEQGAGVLTSMFVKNKRTEAGISAAIQAAKAVAAYAESNIPAGIGHTIAAAKFTAVAAGAGGGGAGGGGGGAAKTGGAATPTTAARRDPEDIAREQARIIGEELGRGSSGAGAGVNLTVNFSSLAPDPHQSRTALRAVEREARNILR